MAITSYTTQLENVQAAIAAIEDGAQSYTVNGRTFARADIEVYYKREQRLRKLVDRESRGGIRVQHATPSTGR